MSFSPSRNPNRIKSGIRQNASALLSKRQEDKQTFVHLDVLVPNTIYFPGDEAIAIPTSPVQSYAKHPQSMKPNSRGINRTLPSSSYSTHHTNSSQVTHDPLIPSLNHSDIHFQVRNLIPAIKSNLVDVWPASHFDPKECKIAAKRTMTIASVTVEPGPTAADLAHEIRSRGPMMVSRRSLISDGSMGGGGVDEVHRWELLTQDEKAVFFAGKGR